MGSSHDDGHEPFGHRDSTAIVGIGATDFSKASGRSELKLAAQASMAALTDAGIDPADVDGIVRCDHDLVQHNALAETLGVRNLTYWGSTGPGGVAPCAMVGQAVAAIQSGLATTVLVYRSLNGRSGRRFGLAPAASSQPTVGGSMTYDEFFLPYGLLTAGQMFALIAQRHMHEYGTTPEQFGKIALTCRAMANRNPNAQMYDRTLSMEQYLESRMISSPLRLYDFCLETDGAAAVVVTSTERAKDLRQPPAVIRAIAQSSGSHVQPGMQFGVLTRPSITRLPSGECADVLYSRAGLGPDDVDVAQLYDCFSITALVQLEDYGFCKPGEGGPFAESGAIDLGGSIPINTSGGHMSEGYIHGMNHVLEGVRQIRGTSTSQVEGAEVSLVTSAPPPGPSALILTKAG
jgi:acetyl-CoA acetyltransferase